MVLCEPVWLETVGAESFDDAYFESQSLEFTWEWWVEVEEKKRSEERAVARGKEGSMLISKLVEIFSGFSGRLKRIWYSACYRTL